MDFNKTWNRFAKITTTLVVVVIVLIGVAFVLFYTPEVNMPIFPDLSYFMLIAGFIVFFLVVGYGILISAFYLWSPFAFKHHTKNEILEGIEEKFSKKSGIYRLLEWLLR